MHDYKNYNSGYHVLFFRFLVLHHRLTKLRARFVCTERLALHIHETMGRLSNANDSTVFFTHLIFEDHSDAVKTCNAGVDQNDIRKSGRADIFA